MIRIAAPPMAIPMIVPVDRVLLPLADEADPPPVDDGMEAPP